MHYSDSWEEAKNLVKERADIVEIIREHVDLKRSGFRYLGSCPFHQEKTPSFTVHPDQQFYHCFGCKASGDVFSFMMEYHHLDFPEALKTLAQRYQVELPEKKRSTGEIEQEKRRRQMFAMNDRAAALYHDYLRHDRGAEHARAYLRRRGIPDEVQRQYRLGYAPSVETAGWNFLGARFNEEESRLGLDIGLTISKEKGRSYDRFRDRIMFPICDNRGQVCGFGGRILGDGEPKYLNSPESPIYNKSRLLFGLYHQREAIRRKRRAVLVEGNFDLLSLVARGVDQVVAPLGTALTREQLRLLKPMVDEVILLFDGDEAGLKAAERSVPLFLAEQISGRVALLPQNHDPDTFIAEFGVQRLEDLLHEAGPLPEFVLQQFVERHGETLDGKFRIIEELRPLLKAAATTVQRETMAKHFAAVLDIAAELLLSEFQPRDRHRQTALKSPAKKRTDQQKSGLDGALQSVVGFMVRNPCYFKQLLEHEIDKALEGTAGETICIQLKALHDQGRTELDPEELFSELPPGEERSIVASILTKVADHSESEAEKSSAMLDRVLAWLQRQRLKRDSETLMQQIKDAEKTKDFARVSELIQEKMRVDVDLKSI